jgi:deoxycytidylate deaminase
MSAEIIKPPSYFDEAYKLSLTSPYGRFRVGALIVQKKAIIAMGVNSKKTHTLQKRFARHDHLTPWLHAEVHSLTLSRPWEVEGSDIYVVRALKNGDYGNSKPCSGCHEALKFFGIKRMFYFEDGSFKRELVCS